MTSETDDTREGKGRVIPGPSPSAHTWFASLGAAVVLFAAAAAALFATQAHQDSSPAALAALAASGAFLGVLIAVGLPKVGAGGRREWLLAASAGAGGLAIAPWLVMANRYTDAPPGSEVLFFTTAAWGALLGLALAISSRERISRIGGALLALAGAAALVANWERPSSFSPFVRFVREETVMLLAGVLWVALVLALVRAARRGSLRSAAVAASLGGLAAAAVLCMIASLGGTISASDFGAPGVLGFGISSAFAMAGMLVALRSGSAGGIAGAYLLVPSAVSMLLVVEQILGPLGPRPIVIAPAAAAMVCTIAGIVTTADWGTAPTHADASRAGARWAVLAARICAAVALTAAIVGLATPAMEAAVTGLRADGSAYEASFSLYGWEVAGPWLAFGIALATLGLAIELPRGRAATARSLALLVGAAALLVASPTPLRTLTSFIPSDVQVDYGSEFARISFEQGSLVWVGLALGGALLALALAWFARMRLDRVPDDDGAATR